MTVRLLPSWEKLAFGAALVAAAAGGAWWWTKEQSVMQPLRAMPTATVLRGAEYEALKLEGLARAPKAWTKPGAQSQGAGWVYEVFTPPVIYYHALARAFSVTPPGYGQEGAMAFDLELLDVKRELYRLQLMGYLGAPNDYLAAFVSPKLPETLLARPGRRFDELGLALRSFEVRKVNIAGDGDLPVYDIAAFATVRDEQTGEEVTLDSRSRRFTDIALAVLRLAPAAKPREVREGDEFQEDGATYRVERIQLDPPEVVVAKSVPGLPFPELRILKPANAAAVAGKAAPPAQRFDQRARPGVAGAPESR